MALATSRDRCKMLKYCNAILANENIPNKSLLCFVKRRKSCTNCCDRLKLGRRKVTHYYTKDQAYLPRKNRESLYMIYPSLSPHNTGFILMMMIMKWSEVKQGQLICCIRWLKGAKIDFNTKHPNDFEVNEWFGL